MSESPMIMRKTSLVGILIPASGAMAHRAEVNGFYEQPKEIGKFIKTVIGSFSRRQAGEIPNQKAAYNDYP